MYLICEKHSRRDHVPYHHRDHILYHQSRVLALTVVIGMMLSGVLRPDWDYFVAASLAFWVLIIVPLAFEVVDLDDNNPHWSLTEKITAWLCVGVQANWMLLIWGSQST